MDVELHLFTFTHVTEVQHSGPVSSQAMGATQTHVVGQQGENTVRFSCRAVALTINPTPVQAGIPLQAEAAPPHPLPLAPPHSQAHP